MLNPFKRKLNKFYLFESFQSNPTNKKTDKK